MSKKNMRGLKIHLVDLDKLYRLDIKNNTGFKLDESIDYTADPKGLLYLDSLYSHRFGVATNDPADIKDKVYRCGCGGMVGSDNNGLVCGDCGTDVSYRVSNNSIRGWFVIPDKKRILTPVAAMLLHDIVGESNIRRLIDFNAPINLINLYDEWETFLLKYGKKKKMNAELIDLLISNKSCVFMTKIPVSSKRLRLNMIDNHFGVNKVTTVETNNLYTKISATVNDMGDALFRTDSQLLEQLKELYICTEGIYVQETIGIGGGTQSEPVFAKRRTAKASSSKKKKGKTSQSKKKMLRGYMYSFRVPYTARQMLNTAHDIMDIDKIHVSHDVFRGIYKEPVRDFLLKKKIGRKDIRRLLDLNTPLTSEGIALLNAVLDEMRSNGSNVVLLNRQPTIYEASTLAVLVDKITPINVVRVHPSILGHINGDIDGDVMSIFSLPDDVDAMSIMSPREYFLDYTGELSGIVKLVNDHQIHAFMMMDGDDGIEVL